LEKEKSLEKSDYSAGVLKALKDAIDYIALKPEYAMQFIKEFEKKVGDIVDALMESTKEEYRLEIMELFKSVLFLVKAWVKKRLL